MYRQYDLQSDDLRLTCWLEVDPRLKRGARLKLHDSSGAPHPTRWWTITAVSQVHLSSPPDTRWRVGGLS